MPIVGSFVQKFGIFGCHEKAVCKTLRYPQLPFVFSRQFNTHPSSKIWRPSADIYCNIKNGPDYNTNQLTLGILYLVM
ncbi:protein of unknown function [Cupriavidus taiwanensis]|uniref:Uncharacterized protein n=1 Tax=Cupriavidus taiwanensis TaxID=164546 RepID=A0A7Z7J9B4_9BURK|nr:hypothetical protein CBM2597_A110029 [Cupriavidus taiwanensis]SPC18771.1 hypothetical protein CBM2594_A80210 [Cupriavidus taiwanensis]SPD41138.1 protein of unknown function [Cupriavidus taiwanensis]